MDAIHGVLPHDHPLVGTGMHILEEVRHLFTDLAPDMLVIEMTLADAPEPTPAHRAEVSPQSSRVLVLQSSQHRAHIFGLLTDESDVALTELDALQIIGQAIRAGNAGAIGMHRHKIVAKLPRYQLEETHTASPNLTPREVDVLRQLIIGASDRDIGAYLGISEATVHYHLKNIYRKLKVKSRSEAIAWAAQAGWGE